MSHELWPVKVRPLRWWGGKQRGGKADWIASLLPWEKESTYVEPFGGMASVMARRYPVKCEIYNDLDGRAVNWFRVMREQTEEFSRLLSLTPHSREEYERAVAMIDDDDNLVSAWAFHIVVQQGMSSSIGGKKDWSITKNSENTHKVGAWKTERVMSIVNRFRFVQFENKDAVELLSWLSDRPNAVIYCDPPYFTSTTSKYQHGKVDIGKLTDVLLEQSGRIAISGYAKEWAHLGWQRHEKESWIVSNGANKISEPRTEVLWTNYDAHADKSIGGLFDQTE